MGILAYPSSPEKESSIFLKKQQAKNCVVKLSYYLPGVVVWAANFKIISNTISDSACESDCFDINTVFGWTRDQGSNACYCHTLPFGPGQITATASSAWSSGFYSNANFTNCGNYYVIGQEINFTPDTMWANIKTYELCAQTCFNTGYSVASYNDNIAICNCGTQSSFQTSAMTFNSGYVSIFNFGLGN